MLTDARAKKFQTFIFPAIDQLGRNTLEILQIIEEFKSLDIRPISLTERRHLDTKIFLHRNSFSMPESCWR